MAPIGWQPEHTATYHEATKALAAWVAWLARQCLLCQGQGIIWMASREYRRYLPVQCQACKGKAKPVDLQNNAGR